MEDRQHKALRIKTLLTALSSRYQVNHLIPLERINSRTAKTQRGNSFQETTIKRIKSMSNAWKRMRRVH